jgi:outer membrane lipoprotein-sorting protein
MLGIPGPAHAVDADETDPEVIMRAAEQRETGDKQTSRLQITIEDKNGRQRTRVVQSWRMDFEEGSKQLVLFEKPADVRNAGLLSIDYSDGAKADDQWLYLPSLGKTTRISSADKSGSFMGTDLTYSDLTQKDPSAYTYAMIEQDVTVDGERCWLIEARPKTEKEKSETGYLKSQVWMSKEKLMPVRVKAWVLAGKKMKYTKMSEIQKVDGVWVAHRMVVQTKRGGQTESTSTMVFSNVKTNDASVTAELFSERKLEQGL